MLEINLKKDFEIFTGFIFEIFSTREVAILFWLTVFIIAISCNKEVLSSFKDVLRVFWSRQILIPLLVLITWIGLIIMYLNHWGLWNISMLKDTIFWQISSAFTLYLNINKARDLKFFRNIVLDNLKIIIILEFVLNFYTFSLPIELMFIPLATFLHLMIVYSESPVRKEENQKVASCLKTILLYLNLSVLSYCVFKTFTQYYALLTILNFKSLMLPIVLTIVSLPYFYFLALYMNYETLFIRLPFIVKDKKRERKIKKYVLLYANLDLNKLNRISNSITYKVPKKKLKKFIKNSSKNIHT